jgi:hypothetical protein
MLMMLALNDGQDNKEQLLERMKREQTLYLRMNYDHPCGENLI